jgi:GT2 family glycosyltransferase
MPERTISLVVVTYQSARLARALLDGIAGSSAEVLVVDSASPDDAADLDALAAAHPEAKLIRLARNVGYGAAANEGARHASGDVIVVANADIVIDAGALDALAARVGRDGVVLAAPRFVGVDGALERSAHRRDLGFVHTVYTYCGPFAHLARRLAPDWHPSLYPSADHDRDLDCVHVLGALMAIDAGALRAAGGFDERFFLYREETDLCVRLRESGGRVLHAGSVTATHLGGGSTADSWPYQGNVHSLRSHYLYLEIHRGRLAALAIRAAGALSAAVWWMAGPAAKRPVARRALRWHVGLAVDQP